jgi:hypothetical protein
MARADDPGILSHLPVPVQPAGLVDGIVLPQPLLDRLRRMRVLGLGFPAVYRALALALRDQAGVDEDTRRWYLNAAAVNDRRSTEFIHFFARSYLAVDAWRQTRVQVRPDSATMQRCSDDLAERVLGPMLSGVTDRVPRFAELGPIETQRMARRLIPGLVLERTVWPAYGQLAWAEADGSWRAIACRFLPSWASGLPRWLCPADIFSDDGFLTDLSDEERRHIRASARRAGRHARQCARAGRWINEDLFAPLPD